MIRANFILFASIVGASIAQDVGKECTWGPSYWCSTVKAAKDCGAFQFCIRNTWSQSSFVKDLHDDNTCTFCEKMVTDIRDYVTSDQTEQAIVAFADKACASLSDKFIADECKGIANLYIVQIIQMLRSNMEPQAVCRAIGLCATADLFISPVNYRSSFSVSQNLLTRLAADKLKTARVPSIFKTLASNTSKYGSSMSKSTIRAFTGSADDQCTTCKQGVEDLKIVFSNVQARDEVIQILKSNICPRFVLPAECDKLIDNYAPEIFQTIVNLDPLAACETIGLCVNEESNKIKPLTMEMASLKPARSLKPVKASAQCIMCEYIVSTVMQALDNNATDQQIINTVTNICNILPSTVKSECQQFVTTYGQELIDLLTHSTDPQTICTLIGLCSNQQQIEDSSSEPTDVNLNEAIKSFVNMGPVLNGFADDRTGNKKIDSDAKCYMCRIVSNYLMSILMENYTTLAVEDALDKVCNFLPGGLATECQDFVTVYTPQLLVVIMSSLNTQQICEAVDLCPPANAAYANGKAELEEQIMVKPFNY